MKVYLFLLCVLLYGFCGGYANEFKVSGQKLDASGKPFGGKDVINVGAIVDMGSWKGKVVHSCIKMAISEFYNVNGRYRTRVDLHMRDSKGDSFLATAAALDLLENVKVHAIIIPTVSNEELFLARLADKANVPLLSLSSISSHNEHPYFFQVGEDETTQFHGVAALFGAFGWKSCGILYEDSADAREVQSYLYDILHANHIHVAFQTAISIRAADDVIIDELHKLKTKSSIVIVNMPSSLASRVFVKAKSLQMMSKGFAWILTSKTMNFLDFQDSSIYDSMEGALGFKPFIASSRKFRDFSSRWKKEFQLLEPSIEIREIDMFGIWAYDAAWAIAEAVERAGIKFSPKRVQGIPSNLSNVSASNSGPALRSQISSSNFTGLTGEFHLVNRKLVHGAYEIVNVIGKGGRRVGFWTSTHGLTKFLHPLNGSSSNSTFDNIIWPGISITAPTTHLVQMRGRSLRIGVPANAIPAFVSVWHDLKRNLTKFDGLSVDVFRAAVDRMPFAISFEFIPFNESYSDLIMQVYSQTYDAAVGDITITSNRSQYVDFTYPYTDLGVGIVAKLEQKNRWFFLRPLDKELWILSAFLFVLTGFVVWLIEHPTNEQFQGPPARQIGTVLWFAASTLVYAHRENLQSNLSRFVVGIWLFVVLILTSSYTANLSAILTVRRIQFTNNDYIGYWSNAVMQGIVASNLNFADNRLKPYQSLRDYYEALNRGSKNGGVSAIFDEIPYIKLFLGNYPDDFAMINSSMTTNGFGFAFQKGSPLAIEMSKAIVELREEGKLTEIEKKWFTRRSSVFSLDSKPQEAKALSIDTFSGLFLVSGISKAIAVLIFIIVLIREKLSIGYYVSRVFAVGKLSLILRYLSPRTFRTINGS